MHYMALDVGERRIGVAASDPSGTLASALRVIERRGLNEDVRVILALAQERGVEQIVIGNPVSLSGDVGPQARRVRRFADALQEATSLPVMLWDERFSTVTASRRLHEAGVHGARQKARLDASAAAVFLQDYLDYVKERQN